MSDPQQWPGTSPAAGPAAGPGATPPAAAPSPSTTPAAAPSGSDADVRYVAERLLAAVREDLGRADAKAAILLSGAVALVAVLFSARRGGYGADVAEAGAGHGAQTVLALCSGLLWMAGLVMLVAVLVPRTRIAADRTFMRDVTSGVPAAALLPRLAESGTDVVRWTVDQACALGAVLARKYVWLRSGVCCLALGAILALLSELWG